MLDNVTVPVVHDIDCSRGTTLQDGTCIWPSYITTDPGEPPRVTYSEAQTKCEQKGRTLAILDTEEKYNALTLITDAYEYEFTCYYVWSFSH